MRRLLGLLERYRDLLAADEPEPFRRRHLVQTCAQICIDLASHVISSDGHRVPRSYSDTFRVLAEVGVLDDALARRLSDLAGARNVIVQLYAEVDDERLAAMVRGGGLDDLGAFAARIAALTA